MTIEQIISKREYLTPSRYVSGRIIEYDMRSANISIMRHIDMITQESYEKLKSLPKIIREREVGLMEKSDPSIYTSIANGIKEAKLELAAFNKLEPEQIIRVANDAVYVNSMVDLSYTKFGDFIEFVPKNMYNVYCNLNGKLIFCRFDPDGNIHIDTKCLGKNSALHRDCMIYTIMSTITILERSSVQDAIDYLYEICEAYLARKLPVGFYREFNVESMFRSNYKINGCPYCFSSAYETDKSELDINYNYTILRELWSILLEFYTREKR